MLCFYWSTVIESGEKHQNIHIISCEKQPQPLPSLLNTNNQEQTTTITAGDNYSYVQLTAIHDYNYPVVDEPVSSVIHARRDSTCSLKKRSAIDMAAPPTKEAPLKSRLRCRYVVDNIVYIWCICYNARFSHATDIAKNFTLKNGIARERANLRRIVLKMVSNKYRVWCALAVWYTTVWATLKVKPYKIHVNASLKVAAQNGKFRPIVVFSFLLFC